MATAACCGCKRTFRLFNGCLEHIRLDVVDGLPLLYDLPFLEQHGVEVAGNARSHIDALDSFDPANEILALSQASLAQSRSSPAQLAAPRFGAQVSGPKTECRSLAKAPQAKRDYALRGPFLSAEPTRQRRGSRNPANDKWAFSLNQKCLVNLYLRASGSRATKPFEHQCQLRVMPMSPGIPPGKSMTWYRSL